LVVGLELLEKTERKHRTSNIEYPMKEINVARSLRAIRCWALDVGYWMFI